MASVFKKAADKYFTTYHVTLRFLSELHGGLPSDPKMIAGWILRNGGLQKGSEQHRSYLLKALAEQGWEPNEEQSQLEFDALLAVASEEIAASKVVSFRRVDGQLCMEERNIKAMLKEAANIALAGQFFSKLDGKPLPTKNTQIGKGMKSLIAEWVFPTEPVVKLGVQEPDMVVQKVSHTPNGPGLSQYEAMEPGLEISFDLEVAKDLIPEDVWEQIWVEAERNGLGANRSLGCGRFEVTRWEKAGPPPRTRKTATV